MAAVAGAVVTGAVGVSPATAGTRYVTTTYHSLGDAGPAGACADLSRYWDGDWILSYNGWAKTWQGRSGGTF